MYQYNCMLITFIRTLVIFVTLFVIMRIMGKSQIGEMQPFEFVVTLIVADFASIPMADVSIPLTYGIVGIFGIFLLHQILALIEKSGNFGKILVSGKPSLVLNKNGVDLKELKKNNLGVEDLISSMRTVGYLGLEELDYAIFESNGKLSAFPKKQSDSQKPSSFCVILVSDGKINNKNLEKAKIEKSEIENFIKSQNQSVKKVDVLTINGNGGVYFQAKGEEYKLLSFPLKEGVEW